MSGWDDEKALILPGQELKEGSGFDAHEGRPKGSSDPHKGIDMNGKGGSSNKWNYSNPPVFAPVDGTVVRETPKDGGLTIEDSHTHYLHTYYHMSSRLVHKGDEVVRGKTQVGTMGAVGHVTGPHLHYEIQISDDQAKMLGNEAHHLQNRKTKQWGWFISPKHYWDQNMYNSHGANPSGAGGTPAAPSGGSGAKPSTAPSGKSNGPGFPTGSPPDSAPRKPQSATPGAQAPPSQAAPSPAPPAAATPAQPSPPQDPVQEKGPLDDFLEWIHKHLLSDSSPRRSLARREDDNIMATKGPDVLKTPIAGKMVPIAYNSVAHLNPSKRVAQSVFVAGKQDFHLNSRSAKIKGHRKGTGKGVQVAGYRLYSHAKTASSVVYSEGWAEVRDGDPAWINHPTVGPVEPSRPMTTVQVASAWPAAA